MYADRARFGALGSFLDLARGAFSALSAALRCRYVSTGRGKVDDDDETTTTITGMLERNEQNYTEDMHK
jgi:hypothetical protein